MIQLDKHVPIPEGMHAGSKFPWTQMDVGDSFLAPGVKNANSMNSGIAHAQRKTGFTFRSRNTPDGVRVWRIA